MNPSRAIILFIAVQTIVAATMFRRGARAICEMLGGIGHDPANDDLMLRMTRIMSHEFFPIATIVLIVFSLMIVLKLRPDRLPWVAFGFVLGGSIFLFGVTMLLVRVVAAIGPRMI